MDEYRVPREIISRRFRRVLNLVVKDDEEQKESATHVPAMSFTHFTRAGVPTAFSIGRLVEGNFPIFKIITPGSLAKQGLQVVVIGETFNVLPTYHQRARIVFPVRVHGRLVHVGNSSFTVENAVKDAQLGDDLITARRSFVLMNVKTGKAEKLVGHIRQKIESTLHNGINKEFHPILRNFPKKPTKCFELPVYVRHSDTDTLYHSNHASYYTYCLDVATEGARLGHFRLLKGDLLSHRLELMESLFKGESFPGDKLQVSVWENQAKPSDIFSQVEKEGEIIWLGRIGFRLELESRL